MVNVTHSFQKLGGANFPGGAVVKNLPANAGDTGSSPGPGRSHMPSRQLLSLWSRACEPQLLKPASRAPQRRVALALCN